MVDVLAASAQVVGEQRVDKRDKKDKRGKVELHLVPRDQLHDQILQDTCASWISGVSLDQILYLMLLHRIRGHEFSLVLLVYLGDHILDVPFRQKEGTRT